MSVGFCITFIGLLTRRYIEQTPWRPSDISLALAYLSMPTKALKIFYDSRLENCEAYTFHTVRYIDWDPDKEILSE
jgi:hypothetical protein